VLNIEIRDQACRGCRMCVEVCPTKVFDFSEADARATVREVLDCIACLSCAYLCPSGALTHTDYPVVKNFYRDTEFSRRMERFL
jgi:NAD-dependent dihydropyrimidine dehydrogenase PreA subunit